MSRTPFTPPRLPLPEETQEHCRPEPEDVVPHRYDPAPIPLPICYCGEPQDHPLHREAP